jgi:ABC-type uncharacterized transport system substrate-binding protein
MARVRLNTEAITGRVAFHAEFQRKDEVLMLEFPNAEAFRRRFPKLTMELWDCTAFVNERYEQRGQRPTPDSKSAVWDCVSSTC